jgi:hypothetical protein
MTSHADIDPLSNFIRPRQVVLRRDLKDFLIGPWPPNHVQSFLHELTHHWCFHSPLGTTLALLRARALRYPFNVAAGESDAVARQAQFDDMLAVDTVLRLLRPLSEGMALFAEYDINPGSSQIVTTPMTWAALMLSSRSAIPDISIKDQASELTRLLGNMRLRSSSLRRKMAFLSRPLSELETAYYDGYLSIKRIYHDLLKRSERLRDTDLFLSYIRAFFFEDPGAVAILTRRYSNPTKRLMDYLDRFKARMDGLYEADIDEDLRLFEEACNKPPGHRYDFELPGIGSTTEEQNEARDAHRMQIHDLEDSASMDQKLRDILNVQRGWMARRAIAFIVSEPALIQIRNKIISVWPDPRDDELPLSMGGRCLATSTRESTSEPVRGWMSLVLVPPKALIAPVYGIDDEVVAIEWPSGRERDPELESWLANPLHAPPVIARELRTVSEWVQVFFNQAPPPLREIIDAARDATTQTWSKAATALARHWTIPPSDAGAAALYRPDRLWEYFAPDQKRFETFVALGTLRGIDVLMPSIRKSLQESGWNVPGALTDAIRINKETGLNFLGNNNGVFEWLI